jgi:hypothetical protein
MYVVQSISVSTNGGSHMSSMRTWNETDDENAEEQLD